MKDKASEASNLNTLVRRQRLTELAQQVPRCFFYIVTGQVADSIGENRD